MGRLQAALHLPNQNQLAKAMGMASNTYAQRKKNASIPWEEVLDLVEAHGLDADWIVSGKESSDMTRAAASPAREPAVPYAAAVDVDLLAAVLDGVEAGLADRRVNLPPEKRARIVALVYDYAQARGGASREAFARFLEALIPE